MARMRRQLHWLKRLEHWPAKIGGKIMCFEELDDIQNSLDNIFTSFNHERTY
jgi:hypothetical protein